MKRIFRLLGLTAALLIVCSSISVFATETNTYKSDLGMVEFSIPADMYVFTEETSITSEDWTKAGIEDPTSQISEDKNIGCIAHFVSADTQSHIYLCKKESTTNEGIFSFALLNDEDKETTISQYRSKEEDQIQTTAQWCEIAGQPFIDFDIRAPKTETQEAMFEHDYITIINGFALNFSTHSTGAEISEETLALLKSMVNSVKFTEILEKPESVGNPLLSIAVLGAVIALVVGFILINHKRGGDMSRELAAKVASFRESYEDNDSYLEAPVLFANSTERSKRIIHDFSFYTMIMKNPVPSIATLLIAIGGFALLYTLEADWWMILILLVALGYCIFSIVSSPRKLEKSLNRSYSKERNNTGVFEFREDEFTVGGIQQKTPYPYFQISCVRENKGVIYLYIGDIIAYYLDEKCFTTGDATAFLEFINKKIKDNKYRRT